MAYCKKLVAEKWKVECYADGRPMWTYIRSESATTCICMDEEELRDMYYALGRMIDFIERHEK